VASGEEERPGGAGRGNEWMGYNQASGDAAYPFLRSSVKSDKHSLMERGRCRWKRKNGKHEKEWCLGE
jgi:hypothetical protein